MFRPSDRWVFSASIDNTTSASSAKLRTMQGTVSRPAASAAARRR
jgi:hypothetical protein